MLNRDDAGSGSEGEILRDLVWTTSMLTSQCSVGSFRLELDFST